MHICDSVAPVCIVAERPESFVLTVGGTNHTPTETYIGILFYS